MGKTAHTRNACLQQKVNATVGLTPIRKRVLELIIQQYQPVTAYELLRLLRQERVAEPPTIYRALSFLLQKGLIHRIHSKNAYIACQQPIDVHHGYILLCKKCGNSIEMQNKKLQNAIQSFAADCGFHLDEDLTEILGICRKCH